MFWDFDTNNGTGGWSRNGVNIRNFTEDESGFKVTCASSHLTSFVVLVSVVDKVSTCNYNNNTIIIYIYVNACMY